MFGSLDIPSPAPRRIRSISILAVILILGTAGQPSAAVTGPGVIAYVLPNNVSGDEIHLVTPDGSQDERIYSTGQAEPAGADIYDISSLAWRPDAVELAFASDHEYDCSFLTSDIFSIRPNGGGYRRITQAPACAELANYPQGSVTVQVQNLIYEPLLIYFQGSRELEFISGSGSVTFSEVADFGVGKQYAIATDGSDRWFNLAGADVQAGGHVTAEPVLTVSSYGLGEFGADWPSWDPSGSALGFVLGLGDLLWIAAQPGPLEIGNNLFATGVSPSLFSDYLAWSPVGADKFLYREWDGSNDEAIYLGTAGAAGIGQLLVAIPALDRVEGLAWLPDGSGFVYSRTEQNAYYTKVRANIFRYSFASGQSTRVTDFADQFTGRLSVSPDGEQMVFELADSYDYGGKGPRDLWIADLDGSSPHLLVSDARAPAWSPRDLPEVQTLYLPMITR